MGSLSLQHVCPRVELHQCFGPGLQPLPTPLASIAVAVAAFEPLYPPNISFILILVILIRILKFRRVLISLPAVLCSPTYPVNQAQTLKYRFSTLDNVLSFVLQHHLQHAILPQIPIPLRAHPQPLSPCTEHCSSTSSTSNHPITFIGLLESS